jgi:hypothetical protein
VSEKPVIYSPTDPVAQIVTLRGQEVSDLTSQFARSSSEGMRLQNATGDRQLIGNQVDKPNRSQIVTGSQKHRDPRFLPYAFTEHGAVMAANILRSERAVQMSVFVVRAFIRMRAALADNRDLARKLASLEKEIKARLDVHESAIVDTLRRLMEIIDPPALPEPPKKGIGFQVKESRSGYRVNRKGWRA